MRYAVNIADLLIYDPPNLNTLPVGPLLLLQPVLESDRDKVIMAEYQRWDGMAVLISEDCTQERWDAIYEVVRKQMNIPKYKLRIYKSKTGKGGWERI